MGKMDLMKRGIYLVAIALLLGGSGYHCKKSADHSVWTGKLVLTADCDDFVVQLQSGPVPDSGILTKSWTDSATGNSYTDVFRVKDVCTFAEANLSVGDVFTFTLNGAVPAQVCMICNVVPNYPMPAANNAVTNIQLVTTH